MRKMLSVLGSLTIACVSLGYAQDQDTLKTELQQIKEALQGVSEAGTEYRAYVDALRKIKISGYIQAQWRFTDVTLPASGAPYEIGRFSGGSFPGNVKNLFAVRRGRVKVNYDNTLTQFVVQVDAVQSGLSLKDAYIAVTEPWLKTFGLQMGIFDRPFGYEISYSSSLREAPERSRVFQTLFPGERGLGAKLIYAPQSGPLSMLRADLGVFNGSGPTANEFDNYKDIIGHAGLQIPIESAGMELDLGLSGYFGGVRNNSRYLYTIGILANGQRGFSVDSSVANVGNSVERTYVGVDAQLYVDIPVIGGGILRGEYIFGKQPGSSGSPSTSQTISPSSQISGPIYQRRFNGWYVTYIQTIGSRDQLVLKYDVYDPNTDVSASDFIPANLIGSGGLAASDIRFSTLGLGLVHHWDDNVKFLVYYEFVQNEALTGVSGGPASLLPYAADVKDNVLTLRVQHKF